MYFAYVCIYVVFKHRYIYIYTLYSNIYIYMYKHRYVRNDLQTSIHVWIGAHDMHMCLEINRELL